LIYKIYRTAFKYLNCYDICDPLAVAVAMEPETVLAYIEKHCAIETGGLYTKGMVVVDWFDKLSLNVDHKCKIITSMDREYIVDLLIQSV